jgi:methylglutaconyl-CoA hydratase
MTNDGSVATSTGNGVGTITFFHPKGNSLPGRLLAQLAEAVTALGGDSDARVIVLRSEGAGAFCAGASFAELAAISDEAAGKKFFLGFATLILAMIRCPKFIITRVQGKTVGGGVGILAASDYVIATDTASVRLSELAVGIGPFVVGPVIERKIGLAAFTALAVEAGWRDARWAGAQGLYSAVHSSIESADAAMRELGTRLSATNPEAMSRLKKVFWEGTENWDTLLAERAAISGRLVLSDFARKAIASAS